MSYTSPNLTWTGNLAVGATATITYSVTVNNPDTGSWFVQHRDLHSGREQLPGRRHGPAVLHGGAGSGAGADPARRLGASTTTAGLTVNYTVTADNTGQTTDTGVSFTAP